MSVTNPVPVPDQDVTSEDIANFESGLFLNGAQNAPSTSIITGRNVEITPDGYLVPRRKLTPWLPDTVENGYGIYPVSYKGTLYYFTADAGQIKYCKDGDSAWSVCTGSNTITTQKGGIPIFMRVLNNVMCLNGGNGDKLAYADLTTSGFPVVKYTAIADPTNAFTAALTNLTTGSFKIYYSYSYTTDVGETNLAPILTQSINITRDQWQTNTASPGKVTLTRPGTAPTGAKFWNLYVAIASTAGAIQNTDMLQLVVQLDLSVTTFTDDGSLDINLGGTAPTANSTDGPRVKYGIVEDGNPILYGDVDNPQNIWIGGGGPYAMSFSVSRGGYLAQPEQGTNFEPTVVIGFRNGQGIPSLTVLYSNTEGLSKQAVLEQQTVNYGSSSFTVWGVTEQHYGAAGVAATLSAVNYNGQLVFFSTDGVMSMNTQPLRQNVISTVNFSRKSIDKAYRLIKVSAMPTIVGAGWNDKFLFIVPNDGFDTPQQIWILDTTQKGVDGNGSWYFLDIPAQWVGVVSPKTTSAFVYIRQGKSSYKLLDALTTYDTIGGVSVPFDTGATGPLIGINSAAHNTWQADVQAVFYVMNLIGPITVGVNYYNENGTFKTKSKTFNGPTFTPSAAGGYGDPQWQYANFKQIPGYRTSPSINDSTSNVTSINKRIKVPIDDNMNEAQWWYQTPTGYSSYKMRAISFEGINLGVAPDL
jgi:hypothetical protein